MISISISDSVVSTRPANPEFCQSAQASSGKAAMNRRSDGGQSEHFAGDDNKRVIAPCRWYYTDGLKC